jgi:hypothetical protein
MKTFLLITNGFLNVRWQFKYKTDGTELPATAASTRSLCCLKRDGTCAETDFVFRWNGRVHLNRRGRQFSRLLAAEVCASALVMRDTPRSEVVWEYWLPSPFASFPFTSPLVRHCVPSGFKRTLPTMFGYKFLWCGRVVLAHTVVWVSH